MSSTEYKNTTCFGAVRILPYYVISFGNGGGMAYDLRRIFLVYCHRRKKGEVGRRGGEEERRERCEKKGGGEGRRGEERRRGGVEEEGLP